MKSFIKNHTYEYVLTALVSIGAGIIFDVNFGLNVGIIFNIIIALLLSGIVLLFHAFRKKPLLYIILGTLLIILFIVFISSDYKLEGIYSEYMDWWYYGRYLEETDIYAYLLEAVFVFLFTIVAFILQRRYKTRLFSAILDLTFLIYLGFIEFDMPRIAPVALAVYFVSILIEIINNLSGEKKIKTRIMNSMYPVLLVLILFASVVPSSDKPIEWKFFKAIWNGITDTISDLVEDIGDWFSVAPGEFSMSFIGYSEDTDISGDVEARPEIALTLANKLSVDTGVYLVGNTKNIYNGHGWENDAAMPENLSQYSEQELDLLEFLYTLYRTDRLEDYADYCLPREFTVTYDNIKTMSLFYPTKLRRLAVDNPKSLERGIASIKFPKKAGRDTKYQIAYYDLNLGSSMLNELIDECSKEEKPFNSYILTRQFLNRIKARMVPATVDGETDLNKVFSDRRDYIYSAYGQIPSLTSARTIELAHNITDGYSNNYQKALAIERYLRDNYAYTFSPGAIPEDQDVVDYFLFDNRQGYCTYFASAFAVLCRSVGIPTRFVQGFCVDTSVQNRHNTFAIYNTNSHAWADCYIDGVGWISFEATPGFSEYRYNPWTSQKKSDIENADPLVPELYIPTPTPTPEIEETAFVEAVEETPGMSGRFILIIVIIIASILFAFILYIAVRLPLALRAYKKASMSEKIMLELRQIFAYAEYLDIKHESHKTFREALTYLVSTLNIKVNTDSVIRSFERLRYGAASDTDITNKEYFDIVNIRIEMLRLLRFNRSRLMYLYIRVKILLAQHSSNGHNLNT